MRKHLVTALTIVIAAVLAGCDAIGDDSEAERFDGAWEITEVESQNTDYTSLVLARYSRAVMAFVSEEDDFSILLDVNDSPDDILIQGEFDVDADDAELNLFSNFFPGTYDFDYIFESEERVILTTDDDDPILQTVFGVDLDLEEIIIVMERD